MICERLEEVLNEEGQSITVIGLLRMLTPGPPGVGKEDDISKIVFLCCKFLILIIILVCR